jgi:hypothetical protein
MARCYHPCIVLGVVLGANIAGGLAIGRGEIDTGSAYLVPIGLSWLTILGCLVHSGHLARKESGSRDA